MKMRTNGGSGAGRLSAGNLMRMAFLTTALLMLLAVTATAWAEPVAVTVVDQDQAPLAGLKVYAFTQSGSYYGINATTDENGLAALAETSAFTPGVYRFRIDYLGHQFWTAEISLPEITEIVHEIEQVSVDLGVVSAGSPAAGVRVYLFKPSGCYLGHKLTTDADGHVWFSLPVGATFTFRADILGHQYWADETEIVSGPEMAVTIDAGGGQLTVTVQEDGATPMTGVKVYLFSQSGCYLGQKATTDDAGGVGFLVPSGSFKVRADYLGYQFWSEEIAVNEDTAVDLEIAHQETLVTVNGVYQTADPIPNAKVYLFSPQGAYLGQNQITDDAGQCLFRLPARDYQVRVDYLHQQYWSDPFDSAAVDVAIPMADVQVAVTWSGFGLFDVPVYVFTETESYTGIQAATDTAGQAVFRLPAGTWKFRADYLVDHYWGTAEEAAPGQVTEVPISTGGGTFELVVQKDDDSPLEGIDCYVFSTANQYTGLKGVTNSQGLVSFDLPDGEFRIRYDYLGHQFWSEDYAIPAQLIDTITIPHREITLTVNQTFDTPQPVSGATVYLFTGTESYLGIQAITDANGRVAFSLPERDFKVRVDYMSSKYWSSVFNGVDTTVEIPMAEARVQVTGAGHGLTDVPVYVFTENDQYTGLTSTSDATGETVFQLPAGTYKFRGNYQAGKYWTLPQTLLAGQSHTIELATGGGNFSFTVLKQADTPLVGVKCYVFRQPGDVYINMNGITDENGQVSLDVADGSYRIRVDYLGYKIFTDTYTVPQTLSEVFTIPHQEVQVTVNGEMQAPEPLENVKVYLFKPDGSYLGQKQTTGADGVVSFSLPAQDFQLRADYLGVKHWSQVFNSQSFDFNLPLGEARISLTGGGQPLEGVKVYGFTDTGSYIGLKATTDASGQALFRLPIRAYKFRADFMGGRFFSETVTTTAGQTTQVPISAGGGTFSLTVLQGPDTGLAGAKCYVFNHKGAYIGVSGTTDENGLTAFYLPDGDYQFRVDYLGYRYWTDMVTVPDQMAATHLIPHALSEVQVLGLNPGPSPLSGVRVYLFTEAGQYQGQRLTSDADGRVVFSLPDQAYIARADYDGQKYWSVPLVPGTNIIAINLVPAAILPAVQDFTATPVDGAGVALNWTPLDAQTAPTPQGYHIYRRHSSQTVFEQITTSLLDPSSSTYTDSGAVAAGTYAYYLIGQDTAGALGYPSEVRSVTITEIPENTTPVTGFGVAWEQDRARLNWDPLDGYRFQIYRGASASDVSVLTLAEAPPYYDDTADAYHSWYYQIASVREYEDPATGNNIQKIGPLSSVGVLAGQPAPNVTIPDAQANPDNTYTLVSGPAGAYDFQGSYTNLSGDVIVTATLDGQTVTGSGANGSFNITLPQSGQWTIEITEVSGWQSTTFVVIVDVDDQPPELTVNGATQRTTADEMITLDGTAVDTGTAVATVQVLSDRFPDQPFGALLQDTGAWTCQVPLAVGANQLTVVAADSVGNSAQAIIDVTQALTAVPVITIEHPANGETLSQETITLSGRVRSTLAAGQIRMVYKDRIQFPTGSGGDYAFSFDNVPLIGGPNTLTVTAQTPQGDVAASVIVIYAPQVVNPDPDPPVVTINAAQSVLYIAGDSHTVSGSVTSAAGIAGVTVNGQAVTLGGSTNEATFSHNLSLTGTDEVTVTVVATDTNDRSTTGTYRVVHDTTAPEIDLADAALQPPPQINAVRQSPFTLDGTVTEVHLAGLRINGQSVGVSPGSADQWRFSARIELIRGTQTPLTIEAWDLAGTQASAECILSLDSDLTIEVLSPAEGAELTVEGTEAEYDLPVTLRIPGIATDDQIRVSVDGGTDQVLTHSGDTADGSLTMPVQEGDHTLSVSVVDADGGELAATTARFSIKNLANLPLAVVRQEPANAATGVEPNDFIAFYFNKPIDPSLLSVTVQETAHGEVYEAPELGADITTQSRIALTEVHRDNQAVPGGLAHFPEDTMAAFYPQRDFAYGGTIYVSVTYDGAEVSRTSFRIRELPTLVQGFVTDQFGQALEGIAVKILNLGKTSLTNKEGNYGFGFGEPADEMIPAGRYRAVANPDMQNSAFGSTWFWLKIDAERLNAGGFVKIPFLNPKEPFRHTAGGQASVLLAGGELDLDLSQATLSFPDGRFQGALHAQFTKIQEISYPALPAAYPSWVFAIQPAGVAVDGPVQVSFKIPTLHGSHEYVNFMGERVLLVALDPEVLEIVPVGVGLVDKELKRIQSVGAIEIGRLDILGYALTSADNQALLEQYAQGEIGLDQMIGQLQAQN